MVHSVQAALPESIEAFWFTPSSGRKEECDVRGARHRFIREYELDADAAPPLLLLDLTAAGGRRPFGLASGQDGLGGCRGGWGEGALHL